MQQISLLSTRSVQREIKKLGIVAVVIRWMYGLIVVFPGFIITLQPLPTCKDLFAYVDGFDFSSVLSLYLAF